MMLTSHKLAQVGDRAWQEREARRQRRQLFWQVLIVIGLVGILTLFSINVYSNLDARNIRSGFAFLSDRASFEIGESLISVSSNDSFARMFAAGMLNTIKVASVSVITATILGVIVGLMKLSRHPLIRFLGVAHVEFYRNIPLLIQLFAIYLVVTEFLPDSFTPLTLGSWLMLSKAGLQIAVPHALAWANAVALLLGGVTCWLCRRQLAQKMTGLMATVTSMAIACLVMVGVWLGFGCFSGWSKPVMDGFMVVGGTSFTPEFMTLWIGLTTFTSAAIAEIVRAGVLAVPAQQWQAAEALGMTRLQSISYVILPQSLRLAIPPMASQYMNLTKNSSLAVIIGYPDIVSVGNTSIVIMGQALEAILLIMSVYLFLNLVIAVVMNKVNARVVSAPQ